MRRNFGGEKRRKEAARRQKQEEKRNRRLEKRHNREIEFVRANPPAPPPFLSRAGEAA